MKKVDIMKAVTLNPTMYQLGLSRITTSSKIVDNPVILSLSVVFIVQINSYVINVLEFLFLNEITN